MSRTAREDVRDGLPALLPRLWRFGIVLSNDAPTAEDLVQATCIRALERADQFTPGTRLDHWTFAIMSSIWKNELRSRAVRRGHGLADAETVLTTDIRDTIDQTISASQVLSQVQSLPEAQRCVVLFVYVEGHSYKDTAEMLGIPIGTVMSRLAAAKTALARAIDAPTRAKGRTSDGGAGQ